MQYQSECRNALESVVNISKSFQKVFMNAIKLFMAIPDRINFLQMGRYGCYSEQTYRNNFENDDFDWFSFNEAIIREHLKGGRKAILTCIVVSYLRHRQNMKLLRSVSTPDRSRHGKIEKV